MELLHAVKEACLQRFEESGERIQICISKLDEKQLLYRHNDVSNSIANIIVHLGGNITQYILSGIGRLEDKRIRDREFLPLSNINKSDLAERINAIFLDARAVISAMDEFACTRKLVLQGFEMTGIGAVIHVVEHASYHVGQITYLTKMYTGEETKYFDGIDLNVHNA